MRLSKVAKELNIGIKQIVDYLDSKGLKVDGRPNTKINPDAYDILKQNFIINVDKHLSSAAQVRREDKLVDKEKLNQKDEVINTKVDFSIFNKKTKINLALGYENPDVVDKFCAEYEIDHELGKKYFVEIKKFLYLCSSSSQALAPSSEIDKIWHTFILFTRDYRKYCVHFLGKFIDHVPEVYKNKSAPKENFLQNTITVYESEFGELDNDVWQIPSYGEIEPDCSNCSSCSSCNNCQSCSSCEGRGSQPSCVFTGNCFSCTDSGYSCVGENPNDL